MSYLALFFLYLWALKTGVLGAVIFGIIVLTYLVFFRSFFALLFVAILSIPLIWSFSFPVLLGNLCFGLIISRKFFEDAVQSIFPILNIFGKYAKLIIHSLLESIYLMETIGKRQKQWYNHYSVKLDILSKFQLIKNLITSHEAHLKINGPDTYSKALRLTKKHWLVFSIYFLIALTSILLLLIA